MDPLILAATVGTAKGGGVSREAGDEDTIPFSENVEMRREMNDPSYARRQHGLLIM